MNVRRALLNTFFLLVIFANVGCDQISKSIVRSHIDYRETIHLIGEYFILTKVENSGAFLSFGTDFPDAVKLFFLSILPVIVLLGAIYYLMTKKNLTPVWAIGMSFVIGGGMGNIYDRILYGSVTDFFHINFYFFKTGVFNMADVSIMIGMGLLLTTMYSSKESKVLSQSAK